VKNNRKKKKKTLGIWVPCAWETFSSQEKEKFTHQRERTKTVQVKGGKEVWGDWGIPKQGCAFMGQKEGVEKSV